MIDFLLGIWWLWIPALLIWFIVHRDNQRKKAGNTESKPSESARDELWHNYIASFSDIVRTKAEKNLINALLERKTADQLYSNETKQPLATQTQTTVAENEEVALIEQLETNQNINDIPQKSQPKPASAPLDSTLLLLYFGAFLLVASAGLFVALGDLSGGLRTFVLAITAGLLYSGGVWLYKTKPKLRHAGISFVGVGMLIIPLIGVAWYNLIADQTNGALIWLLTSLVCIGVYAHAYSVIKTDFISYLLIGSLVSVVESSVLNLAMPAYVFVWVAIVTAIILQIYATRVKKSDPTDFDPYNVSAQILVPLSILASLFLLPDFASGQLGVSLLLGGAYYGMQAFQSPKQRVNFSAAAQISSLSGIASLLYSISESSNVIAVAFALITSVYAYLIASSKVEHIHTHSLMGISSLVAVGAIIASGNEPWLLVATTGIGIMLASVIWLKMANTGAFIIGSILLMGLPYLIGQNAIEPQVNAWQQLILFSVPAAILAWITAFSALHKKFEQYYVPASFLFIVASVILIITGWISGFVPLLITCAVLATVFASLYYAAKESGWWLFASIYMLIPVLYAFIENGANSSNFSYATFIALAASIIISLISREQIVRAIVVVNILIAPVAIGGGGLGFTWDESAYAFGYLVAMVGCVLARAIARGKFLVSRKVALSSYESSASIAYIIGYTLAACIAVFVSLYADNSRVVTSIVLAFVSLAVIYVGYVIENYSRTLLLLPLLIQGILFSILRPDLGESSEVAVVAILSATLGVLVYASVYLTKTSLPLIRQELLTVSMVCAYIGASLGLFDAEATPALPVSLMIAGGLTLFHAWRISQLSREISITIIVLGLHWLIYLLGVDILQIHTHLFALMLAGFAYWRYRINDKEYFEMYIASFFAVATIPLILEALTRENGSVYGLALIVQQVVFMAIGALLNIRILIQAGLWVALAAVLYQLRGLGWAFLAIVAVVIIAFAIYRLQKNSGGK